jgi:hypothetical protein
MDKIKANKIQDEYRSELQAHELLTNLRWSFLSTEKAMAAHNIKIYKVVLRQVQRKELQNLHLLFGQELPNIRKKHRRPVCRDLLPSGNAWQLDRFLRH